MVPQEIVGWCANMGRRGGTRAEFTQRAERLEAVARTMLDRHRATDAEEHVLVTSDHGVP
jgi:hypothetical protein